MNVKYNKIEEYIDVSKIRYEEPMSRHTTIKVGGIADVMIFPEDVKDIINALKFAKENKIQVTVIGNGSKLLVPDDGIRGVVIKIGSKFADVKIEGEYITVQAGEKLPHLAILAKNSSLSGLEFAAGIPGNIGGAIYMNAGAYGSEMANIVESVTYIDSELNIKTISKENIRFGYRTSIFKQNEIKDAVIISTKLKLVKGNIKEIELLMKNNNDARKSKQPLEYPNAGSTFKRPEGYFVGKLIDDLNLKGYSIGDAQVSTKHSGFIVNKGHATAKDITDLIEYIKEQVLKSFNVKLEEEIIVLGKGDKK